MDLVKVKQEIVDYVSSKLYFIQRHELDSIRSVCTFLPYRFKEMTVSEYKTVLSPLKTEELLSVLQATVNNGIIVREQLHTTTITTFLKYIDMLKVISAASVNSVSASSTTSTPADSSSAPVSSLPTHVAALTPDESAELEKIISHINSIIMYVSKPVETQILQRSGLPLDYCNNATRDARKDTLIKMPLEKLHELTAIMMGLSIKNELSEVSYNAFVREQAILRSMIEAKKQANCLSAVGTGSNNIAVGYCDVNGTSVYTGHLITSPTVSLVDTKASVLKNLTALFRDTTLNSYQMVILAACVDAPGTADQFATLYNATRKLATATSVQLGDVQHVIDGAKTH